MKHWIIIILIIAVQILCLTLIYTWIQNEEAELKDRYDSGYSSGKLFTETELKNCNKILDYLGVKAKVSEI